MVVTKSGYMKPCPPPLFHTLSSFWSIPSLLGNWHMKMSNCALLFQGGFYFQFTFVYQNIWIYHGWLGQSSYVYNSKSGRKLQTSGRMFQTSGRMFRTSGRMFQTSGRMFQTSGRMFQKSGLENYYQPSLGNPYLKGKPTLLWAFERKKIIACFDYTLPRLCLHFALCIYIMYNRMYEIDRRHSKSMSPT